MITVELGWDNVVVVSAKDALTLIEILERAERYESKYNTGGPETHFVYANEKVFTMKVLNDNLYKMAKLAGKPLTK